MEGETDGRDRQTPGERRSPSHGQRDRWQSLQDGGPVGPEPRRCGRSFPCRQVSLVEEAAGREGETDGRDRPTPGERRSASQGWLDPRQYVPMEGWAVARRAAVPPSATAGAMVASPLDRPEARGRWCPHCEAVGANRLPGIASPVPTGVIVSSCRHFV